MWSNSSFSRHGESIANQQNTYTGWSDVGLTAQGKAQAAATGKKIAATGILLSMCIPACYRGPL